MIDYSLCSKIKNDTGYSRLADECIVTITVEMWSFAISADILEDTQYLFPNEKVPIHQGISTLTFLFLFVSKYSYISVRIKSTVLSSGFTR